MVDARGHELEVNIGVGHELLQHGGALVVEALELGSEAGRATLGMEMLVSGEDRCGCAVLLRGSARMQLIS